MTPKQHRLITNVLQGMEFHEAALAAGYSKRTARGIRSRLKMRKDPEVMRALEQVQDQWRKEHHYTFEMAMQEIEAVRDFALENGQAMAAVKAVELRTRISGLYVERRQEIPFDLKGAMDLAAARVINITPKEHFFSLQHAENSEAASQESIDESESSSAKDE